jgi:Icc-related predicted phosphoesterase
LRLLIFSDIHGDWKALDKLLDIEADYYIAAGDMLTWARNAEACGAILQRRAPRVYVLPGNHESDQQIANMSARYDLHDLHGRYIQAGKWYIAGLGYSNPTPFNTPGEYSELQITQRLIHFAELSPLILVCHAPPHGTALDQIRPGLHAGSTAVRQFIERHQPEYFFCGHIHEAEGKEIQMGRTRAINVGRAGFLLEV